jgi:hypothetical protein
MRDFPLQADPIPRLFDRIDQKRQILRGIRRGIAKRKDNSANRANNHFMLPPDREVPIGVETHFFAVDANPAV